MHRGGELESWLVLGEAVAIHIDEALLENGIYQTAKAQPILRAGGPSAYYAISEISVLIWCARTRAVVKSGHWRRDIAPLAGQRL